MFVCSAAQIPAHSIQLTVSVFLSARQNQITFRLDLKIDLTNAYSHSYLFIHSITQSIVLVAPNASYKSCPGAKFRIHQLHFDIIQNGNSFFVAQKSSPDLTNLLNIQVRRIFFCMCVKT